MVPGGNLHRQKEPSLGPVQIFDANYNRATSWRQLRRLAGEEIERLTLVRSIEAYRADAVQDNDKVVMPTYNPTNT